MRLCPILCPPPKPYGVRAARICVVTCVITLPSLPVSGCLTPYHSGTHDRQRMCVEPA